MRRSETRRRVVSAYVRARLERECRERGVAAAICKATGISEAHLSNVRHGKKPVGEDFADAIARHWGMVYDELVQEATRQWSVKTPPEPTPESGRGGRLDDRPEWRAALDEARRFYGQQFEPYYEAIGRIYDDVPYPIDARFIGEMAAVLHSHAQRGAEQNSAPQLKKPMRR